MCDKNYLSPAIKSIEFSRAYLFAIIGPSKKARR